MEPYIIKNPVPTPEEMGEILGLSPERMKALREIMSTPTRRKASDSRTRSGEKAARKKSSRARKTSGRSAKT